MKIFMIKLKDKEEYFSVSSRTFLDKGSIFTDMSHIRKSFSYSKTWIQRRIRYYGTNDRNQYQQTLTKLNNSTIVEYDLVQAKEYDGSGKELIEVEEKIDETSSNILEKLEKIDFSTII